MLTPNSSWAVTPNCSQVRVVLKQADALKQMLV